MPPAILGAVLEMVDGMAANTFPARSSAGAAAAKAITDFILSLVDDPDDVTARATLGITALGIGSNGNGQVVADLDDTSLLSGIYGVTSAGTTAGTNPLGTVGTPGILFHRVAGAGTQGAQIFIARTANRMFWRSMITGVWNAWVEAAGIDKDASFASVTKTGHVFEKSYDLGNPASGGTVTVGNFRRFLQTGTGTKASLIIRLPASPTDGQLFTFSSRCQVTTTTYQNSAGTAISGAPTTLLIGNAHTFIYNGSGAIWYPA